MTHGDGHGHEHGGGHGHGHEYGGGQGHEHGGGHEHGHAHDVEVAVHDALERSAGAGRVLFLDAPSGLAGDMIVAALVDLGVPFEVIERAVAALSLTGTSVGVTPAMAGTIGGKRFCVQFPREQPARTYAGIRALIEAAPLDSAVKDLALRIFARLARAEAEVHRIAVDDVHFHEVGAVDAIVDIVAAAAGFVHVGATVVVSPLPLGRGFVDCEHGRLPLPAPATVLCLRGVPTVHAGIEAELVTPTGAAIAATVSDRFEAWPSIIPDRVGWGCGTRTLPDRPNALRAILGAVPSTTPSPTHVMIETNVDDMTGELAGHAITQLLAAGALDAWASPVTMKKGRPGLVLHALADAPDAERVEHALLRETSSIGVRRTLVSRTERPRRIEQVATRYGQIPVKISDGPHGAPVIKPEFDACARAALAHGVAVRDVIAEAGAVARRSLEIVAGRDDSLGVVAQSGRTSE